jgi:ribosome-associated protein
MPRHRTAHRRPAPRTHAKPHGAAPALRPASPAAEALARRIAALALDKKSLDVVIIDVRGMTSYADYFAIASGESERQVSATAEHIREQLKLGGVSPIGSEGFESGHWVLLDYGEVVAHLFQTEARAFYDLEGLWSDAPRERVA